jgi:NTE family protein
MRVGLVLGAGGVLGASWLIGALEALETETGWSPSEAELIIGTSAGSAVGALVADGVPPAYMNAYASGRALDEVAATHDRADALAELADRAAVSGGAAGASRYRLQRALPPIGPGSWRLVANTIMRPTRHAPSTVLGGWLPRGFISTRPIAELVETFVADEWPDHPNFWAVAADYHSGKRVVFGREDAPPATVGEAVAASCAIPAFYHPVKIGGRRYVDGGMCSTSNLDLARRRDLDLVICLNPTSSRDTIPIRTPGDAAAALMRVQSGRRLAHEMRKLQNDGTELLVLQPTRVDLETMGPNLMSRGRRVEVAEAAVRTTAIALRELRDKDAVLPGRARRAAKSRLRPLRRAA